MKMSTFPSCPRDSRTSDGERKEKKENERQRSSAQQMTRCLAVLLSSFADSYVRPDRSSPLVGAKVWLKLFPASKHALDGFDFV